MVVGEVDMAEMEKCKVALSVVRAVARATSMAEANMARDKDMKDQMCMGQHLMIQWLILRQKSQLLIQEKFLSLMRQRRSRSQSSKTRYSLILESTTQDRTEEVVPPRKACP